MCEKTRMPITQEFNMELYGSSGYLGSFITSSFPGMKCTPRFESPTKSHVFDFSFPNNYLTDIAFYSYLELIKSRIECCKKNHLSYIYMGSVSSLPPVNSLYGQRKFEVEKLVLNSGFRVIHIGLVTSETIPGGRYKQLLDILKLLPIIPIFSSNTFQVYVNQIEDLLGLINGVQVLTPEQELLLGGIHASSLGEQCVKIAAVLEKKTIRINPMISKLFQTMLDLCPWRVADSLKSLTMPRDLSAFRSTVL